MNTIHTKRPQRSSSHLKLVIETEDTHKQWHVPKFYEHKNNIKRCKKIFCTSSCFRILHCFSKSTLTLCHNPLDGEPLQCTLDSKIHQLRAQSKNILNRKAMTIWTNPNATYIPAKAIWTEARYIIIFTTSIKINCMFTTRSRTPLGLNKTKRSEEIRSLWVSYDWEAMR